MAGDMSISCLFILFYLFILLSLGTVYALTEANDLTVKDAFYATLECVVDQCPRWDTLFRPGAWALLFTRLRPKGLRMFSKSEFCVHSENPFLNGQSLCVLCEKYHFLIVAGSIFCKNRKYQFQLSWSNITWQPRHVGYQIKANDLGKVTIYK